MLSKHLVKILFFSSLFIQLGFSQVQFTLTTSKPSYYIGDIIDITLIVTAPKTSKLQISPPDDFTLNPFSLISYEMSPPVVKQDGFIEQRLLLKVSIYSLGIFNIPPLTIRDDSPENKRIYNTINYPINIMSIAKENNVIKDKHPIVEVPLALALLTYVLLIALGLFIVYHVLYFLFKRAEKVLSIQERILIDLENLMNKFLLENGEIKTFYYQFSNIVKNFLQEIHQTHYTAMTTSEIEFNLLKKKHRLHSTLCKLA